MEGILPRGNFKMLLAAFLGLAIVIFYIIMNFKSKFTLVVGAYIFSIVIMVFVTVLYTTKISTYKFSTELDYSIYLFFTNNFKFTIGMVARFLNFSFSLFLFATVSYIRIINKKRWYEVLIFIVPIAVFLFVNDPIITKKLFFLTNSFNKNIASFYVSIKSAINKYNNTIFVVYGFLSLCYAIKSYFEMRLSREKYDLILSASVILLVYICIYAIFICGPYKFITMNNVNFMKIPFDIPANVGNIYIPMFILLMIVFVAAIILYYKPFGSYSSLDKMELVNNKLLDKNVTMILHIYKNAFWGINQYLKFAEESINEPEKVRKNITKSRAIAENHIEMLMNMQSKLDNVRDKSSYFMLDDCIKLALSKTSLPTEKVNIIFDNYDKNILMFGDFEHLSEVFVNLFLNAVQAIEKSKKPDSYIKISAEMDKNYILIDITDNGCGIADGDIKEIFNPFFSKKARNTSGGIGLYYVNNVIRHHYGEISVKSRINEYTTFKIVIPVVKNGLEELL